MDDKKHKRIKVTHKVIPYYYENDNIELTLDIDSDKEFKDCINLMRQFKLNGIVEKAFARDSVTKGHKHIKVELNIRKSFFHIFNEKQMKYISLIFRRMLFDDERRISADFIRLQVSRNQRIGWLADNKGNNSCDEWYRVV